MKMPNSCLDQTVAYKLKQKKNNLYNLTYNLRYQFFIRFDLICLKVI